MAAVVTYSCKEPGLHLEFERGRMALGHFERRRKAAAAARLRLTNSKERRVV